MVRRSSIGDAGGLGWPSPPSSSVQATDASSRARAPTGSLGVRRSKGCGAGRPLRVDSLSSGVDHSIESTAELEFPTLQRFLWRIPADRHAAILNLEELAGFVVRARYYRPFIKAPQRRRSFSFR